MAKKWPFLTTHSRRTIANSRAVEKPAKWFQSTRTSEPCCAGSAHGHFKNIVHFLFGLLLIVNIFFEPASNIAVQSRLCKSCNFGESYRTYCAHFILM
jgi:hypothetical protein